MCVCASGRWSTGPGISEVYLHLLPRRRPAPPPRLLAEIAKQTFDSWSQCRRAGRRGRGQVQRKSYCVDFDFINIIIISPTLSGGSVQWQPQFSGRLE